jgi:tRNA nucleotidyltransferase (CCA-adding enzyme)
MAIISDPRVLRDRILWGLPPEPRALVGRLISSAGPSPIYVVGGALRDATLGWETRDLDLVFEGDAVAIALEAAQGLRVTTHKRFGTATIKTGDSRVDVAMTRSEAYARPGALPKVAPADIETDLRRRDFTVNAMALSLGGEPLLLDPCNGIVDLDACRVRVLHEGSFRDDATRIFRAFRYADRLRFRIEPDTKRLIEEGVEHIAAIGGERLRHEFELIFDGRAASALEGLDDAGALSAVHSALQWDAGVPQALSEGREISDVRAYGFALLSARASLDEATQIVARLKLTRSEAAAVSGVASLNDTAHLFSRPNVKPSGAVQVLERYTDVAVIAFAVISGGTAGTIATQYLTEWKFVRPEMSARDLMEMGVPQGPRIAQGLKLLRAARLDGTARDRDDERVLVARFAKSIRESSAMTGTIELSANGH